MSRLQTSYLVRFIRITRVVLHVARGMVTACLVLPAVSRPVRNRVITSWSTKLLEILNARVKVSGAVPGRATSVLFVANHISWMDILAINAVHRGRFVAKSEVRRWPVWGWLAARAGTLFIKRRKLRDMVRVLREVTWVLLAGDCIILFPEGTTTDGTGLKPFRSGLLETAVTTEALVWPVAIRYRQADGSPSLAPAFVDDLSLVRSVARVLQQPSMHVELLFASPLSVQGKTRKELAREAYLAIATLLNLPSSEEREPSRPASLFRFEGKDAGLSRFSHSVGPCSGPDDAAA